MPGMQSTDPAVRFVSAHVPTWADERPMWVEPALSDMNPDLTDPATLGCLLALVREVWGDENAYVDPRGGWACCVSSKGPLHGHDLEFPGETEAEALVAALEWVEEFS